eukprot:6179447-Pleurochrysis_carterae.AAC.1
MGGSAEQRSPSKGRRIVFRRFFSPEDLAARHYAEARQRGSTRPSSEREWLLVPLRTSHVSGRSKGRGSTNKRESGIIACDKKEAKHTKRNYIYTEATTDLSPSLLPYTATIAAFATHQTHSLLQSGTKVDAPVSSNSTDFLNDSPLINEILVWVRDKLTSYSRVDWRHNAWWSKWWSKWWWVGGGKG